MSDSSWNDALPDINVSIAAHRMAAIEVLRSDLEDHLHDTIERCPTNAHVALGLLVARGVCLLESPAIELNCACLRKGRYPDFYSHDCDRERHHQNDAVVDALSFGEQSSMAFTIIEAAGMELDKATLEDLVAVGKRFYCVACAERGREMEFVMGYEDMVC